MANKNTKIALSKKNFITDEKIPADIAERVSNKIIRARVKMLFNFPFFGSIAMRMPVVAADKWLGSMAVDGKYMYFNHRFVDTLELDELVFVFAHEVLHVAYDHIDRKDYREKDIFNVACDYAINGELIDLGIGKFPDSCEEVKGLHDKKYAGMCSEEIYEELIKQKEKNSSSFDQMLEKLVEKLLDEHLQSNSESEASSDSKSKSNQSSGSNGSESNEPSENGPAKITEEEKALMKAEIKQAILAAAQTHGIGNLPAGVQRMVNELLEPKLDWRSLLQLQLNSIVPADYSFMKLSRTGWHLEAILPGMVTEQMLSIAVAIDMSGSIGQQQATEFLSEVKGIMGQYSQYEIKVFCFDTECYNLQTFSSDNGEEIMNYQVVGGGGTDGGCIFRFLKEENIVPLKLVVFTDGYVGEWGDENYCPTVWVINGSRLVPPFGVHAYFDDVA